MLTLTPLFSAEITLAPPLEMGVSPLGRRRIIEITGGQFTGERLSGKVLPGGADWQLVRADGVAYLDTRYTLETHDGALIYVQNRGYRHGPAEVIERLARGEMVESAATVSAPRRGSRPGAGIRVAEPDNLPGSGAPCRSSQTEVFEV